MPDRACHPHRTGRIPDIGGTAKPDPYFQHGIHSRFKLGSFQEMPMPFTLPNLPYPFEALEPHIDAQTMQIHHGKHHAAYVTNANKALEGTKLAELPVEEVIKRLGDVPEDKRTAVRNNAGGHAN